MALINPVHGLVVPFLCVFTIPLAIFAGITTILAFSVLMFRAAVVYLDIAFALILQYFMGRSKSRIATATGSVHHRNKSTSSPISPTTTTSSASGYSTPSPVSPYHPPGSAYYQPAGGLSAASGHRSPDRRHHRRRKSSYGCGGTVRHSRRSSQASISMASVGTITPIREGSATPAGAACGSSQSQSGLTPSVGIDRDFEGIGGWRLDDGDDSDDWAKINSRLELPLDHRSSSMSAASSAARHQRLQSAGPTTPGDGPWLMMKPTSASATKGRRVLPEDKDWERNAAKGKGRVGMGGSSASSSPNSSRVRMGGLHSITTPPTAILTAMDQQQRDGYFPMISPKTTRKSPPAPLS
ncbi:hypothetical protein B0T17DRAFT_616245 [Bombardia bombarda]|uniref:Uncharacterized protein n=1 Tax=Bombardia bombarda TaxID=252184 RepID=A0AA39XB06_9PEZI|nr:hypothetical protein B0T17DRAFT_616245 [Bombardia bombarda]